MPPPSVIGSEIVEVENEVLVAVRVNGRYDLVPASSVDEPIYDVTDTFEEDPGVLGLEWKIGRGLFFAYCWLHQDPRYHGRGRQLGWEPVDPKHINDPRYTTRDVAGLGKCVCYMDAILFEMPLQLFHLRTQAFIDSQRKDMIERMFGLQETIDAVPDKSSGLMKARLSLESSLDSSANRVSEGIYAEIDSLNRSRQYQERLKADARRQRIPVLK